MSRLAQVIELLSSLSPDELPAVSTRVQELVRRSYALERDVSELEKRYAFPRLTNDHTLLDHQKSAVAWVLVREANGYCGIRGGMLVLEMGLGKTLVALTVVAMTRDQGPTLLVCVNAMLRTMVSEVDKFYRGVIATRVVNPELTGTAAFRALTFSEASLYIISYDTLASLMKKPDDPISKRLFGTQWQRVVADESQKFRNNKTTFYESVMALQAHKKLCLTGTPFINGSKDMESQLRFLGMNDPRPLTAELAQQLDLEGRCILRMSKDEYLPHTVVTTHDVVVALTPVEAWLYGRVSSIAREYLRAYLQDKDKPADQRRVGAPLMITMLLRLRQASVAPHLLLSGGGDDMWRSPGFIVGNISNAAEADAWLRNPMTTSGIGSSKINAVVEIVRATAPDEKVIVFSQWAEVVRIIEMRMRYENIPCVAVVGGMDAGPLLDAFRVTPIKVLVMTTGTGSVGLTLTEASNVVMVDLSWQEADEKQAAARVDRVGQKRPVHIHRLMANTRIEAYMAEKRAEKRAEEASLRGETVEALQDVLGPE